jgi:hypothetical protein
LAAGVFAAYQNALPFACVAFPIAILLVLALRYRYQMKIQTTCKENVALLLFSLLFSIAMVASYNVVISGSTYDGLASENYLKAWGLFDWLGLVVIWVVIYLLLSSVYLKMKERQLTKAGGLTFDSSRKVRVRFFLLLSLLIFVAYIPYWLLYWPGLIYGDSLSSLKQALSGSYNNHHPFAYTVSFTLCIKLMHLFGFSTTSGCALQVLIQMIIMACTLGCFSAWTSTRFGLPKWVGVFIACIFAFTPYFALYSISMWKDPLFSMAIIVVTMGIADVVLGGSSSNIKKRWYVIYFCAFLGCGLLRSNGIFILAGLAVVYFLTRVLNKGALCRSQKYKLLGRSIVAAFVCAALIVGPVYDRIGVSSASKAETYGLMLNQMARVVVEDGVMSEEDAAYMNQLLPLDEYAEVYAPTCVDNLKWNKNFSGEALSDGFVGHWVSMLVKNSKIYIDAWVMETFGYWAPFQENGFFYFSNFQGGVIRNIDSSRIFQVEKLGINASPKILDESLRTLFSVRAWSPPLGLINWGFAFLILCLFLQKKSRYLLVLLPSVFLVATLLVASPIWYWPRYEVAVQYLLPLLCAFYGCLLPRGKLGQRSINLTP